MGDKSLSLRNHPVSAAVSRGCPEPLGRFPRVTHPCAAPVLLRALDLHVLGMPPAFVLSQDQTLRLVQASLQTNRSRNQSFQPGEPSHRNAQRSQTRCLSITHKRKRIRETSRQQEKPKRTQAPETRRPRIPSDKLIQISNIAAGLAALFEDGPITSRKHLRLLARARRGVCKGADTSAEHFSMQRGKRGKITKSQKTLTRQTLRRFRRRKS